MESFRRALTTTTAVIFARPLNVEEMHARSIEVSGTAVVTQYPVQAEISLAVETQTGSTLEANRTKQDLTNR